MKKIPTKILICCAFLFTALSGFSGCKSTKTVDVGDVEFTLSTGLASESPVYPQSVGTAYYIADDGAPANDGLSPDSPKTLADVPGLPFAPGVSVLFKRGGKFGPLNLDGVNVSGSDTNPVTFASYGEGEKPLFENAPAGGNVLNFVKCSNVVLRDLNVIVNGSEKRQPNGSSGYGIRFYYGYAGANKFRNVYIVNNTVTGNGTSKRTFGIFVLSTENTFASSPSDVLTGLYIYGNTVSAIGRCGIVSEGRITSPAHLNGKFTLFKDVHMDGNTVHDVGNVGMYIASATGGTMNRNLVYKTGLNAVRAESGVTGMMAICDDSIDIMYNESYGNESSDYAADAMSIDIDWNTTNIDVRYNHAYGNEGSGIGTMANQNSFIRDNRIENNQAGTNQNAQLTVMDFTQKYNAVADDMHAVRNLKITNNLIVGTPDGKAMFRTAQSEGDPDWTGNEFTSNRVVYTGDNPKKIYYVNSDMPWHKFADNRYYAKDTSVFRCMDLTPADAINAGATPYAKPFDFAAWAKRDTGAALSSYNTDAPGMPVKAAVKFEDGELKLSWQRPSGDIWHYNIYSADIEDKAVDYRDLLGQPEAESFSFKPGHSGVYYITIRPESNTGIYGADLKIKVTLN
ncbi:MAG: right-handed parallel beta-helix repeat-containing protein [Clostridiales bacterium]|nr:right-handed parallel beta-helix repeat-containing protein [Clostridiales bacterium]